MKGNSEFRLKPAANSAYRPGYRSKVALYLPARPGITPFGLPWFGFQLIFTNFAIK
jgi:hypothetical protein